MIRRFRGYDSGYDSGVWFAQIELPAFTKNCTHQKKTGPYIYIYIPIIKQNICSTKRPIPLSLSTRSGTRCRGACSPSNPGSEARGRSFQGSSPAMAMAMVVIQSNGHGSLNVPMFHITQPLGINGLLDGYYKVMSNIPKMGHLPTPDGQ